MNRIVGEREARNVAIGTKAAIWIMLGLCIAQSTIIVYALITPEVIEKVVDLGFRSEDLVFMWVGTIFFGIIGFILYGLSKGEARKAVEFGELQDAILEEAHVDVIMAERISWKFQQLKWPKETRFVSSVEVIKGVQNDLNGKDYLVIGEEELEKYDTFILTSSKSFIFSCWGDIYHLKDSERLGRTRKDFRVYKQWSKG